MLACLRIRRQLGAYLDGELSPQDRMAVERHLARCQPCRTALESLDRLERALQAMEIPPIPPGLAGQIMTQARERQNAQAQPDVIRFGRRLPAARPWAFDMAAAAVLVFGLAVGSYMGWSGGRFLSPTGTARTATQADPLEAYNLDYLGDAPEGSLAGSYLALASNPKGY